MLEENVSISILLFGVIKYHKQVKVENRSIQQSKALLGRSFTDEKTSRFLLQEKGNNPRGGYLGVLCI